MSLGQPLPPEPTFSPEPVTVGSILGNTFRVLGANLVPFILVSCLMILPGVAFLGFRLFSMPSFNTPMEQGVFVASTFGIFAVLQILLQIPAQSALMYGVANQMSGRSSDLGQILRRGFASIVPVLGTSFVVMLAMMGGFILCLIPGFVVMIVLFVAIPVAVVENQGIGDNLRRSSFLTEGYRWTIFGAAIVVGIGLNIVQQVAQQAAGSTGSVYVIMIVTVLLSVITMPIQATMSAVTYMLLRQNKDRINVDDIADVFR